MTFWQKFQAIFKYLRRILGELGCELVAYYFSPYPFLRIQGTFRRIWRHLRILLLKKSCGRPPIPEPVIDLIIDMKRSNWNWGFLRISQELALLGLIVSKETVRKILHDNGFYPPKLKFAPPSWSALLNSYKSVFAMDFTCVIDAFGKQVFILVILDHLKRELVLLNATYFPNRDWLMQQLRNFHFDYDSPEAMIFDRDGIYGLWLAEALWDQFNIQPFRMPARSPWLNGRVERFHRTLKEELIYRLGYFEIDQIMGSFSAYRAEYNQSRPHQALGGKTPIATANSQVIALNQVRGHLKKNTVHGLIKRFDLVS